MRVEDIEKVGTAGAGHDVPKTTHSPSKLEATDAVSDLLITDVDNNLSDPIHFESVDRHFTWGGRSILLQFIIIYYLFVTHRGLFILLLSHLIFFW